MITDYDEAIDTVDERLRNFTATKRWDMGGSREKAEVIVRALGYSGPEEPLVVGDMTLYPDGTLHQEHLARTLTPRLAQLLRAFMVCPNQTLTHSQLYEMVWGTDLSYTSNALATAVATLRRKLLYPSQLRTIRSVGYALRVDS